MSLSLMRERGVPLPTYETDVSTLSAQDILGKIRSFQKRHDGVDDWAEINFLELLAAYPVSMCAYNVSEALGMVIAMYYVDDLLDSQERFEERKVAIEKFKQENKVWISKKDLPTLGKEDSTSYEDLSMIFDRSKATIHEVIKRYELQVRQMLEDVRLKQKAKDQALREMVEEEKQRLKTEQQNNQTSQTERTNVNSHSEMV